MIPGTSWGRDVSGAITQPVPRDNIVYKTHQYNRASDFQRYFLDTHNAGKPVFIGEFGYVPDVGMQMTDVQALMDVARNRGLGWAAWKFDYEGGPNLVEDNTTFTPTTPYGAAVHAALSTTAAVPQVRALSASSAPPRRLTRAGVSGRGRAVPSERRRSGPR